jgi:hypothetical protein
MASAATSLGLIWIISFQIPFCLFSVGLSTYYYTGFFAIHQYFSPFFTVCAEKTRKKYKTDKTLMIWILSVFLIRD